MSRHSLVRALLSVVAAAVVWTTVTSAEARRPQRAEVFLEDWTNCRNGARLTIGFTDESVKLVATSTTGSTLARLPLRLRAHPHQVWALNDAPGPDGPVVSDAPDTDTDQAQPDNVEQQLDSNGDPVYDSNGDPVYVVTPEPLGYAATVTVWWRRPAGQTLNLGLSPVGQEPELSRYRVDNCVLLPRTRSEHFDALRLWLWKFTSFSYGLR